MLELNNNQTPTMFVMTEFLNEKNGEIKIIDEASINNENIANDFISIIKNKNNYIIGTTQFIVQNENREEVEYEMLSFLRKDYIELFKKIKHIDIINETLQATNKKINYISLSFKRDILEKYFPNYFYTK